MFTYRKASLSDVPRLAQLEAQHVSDELTAADVGQLAGQGFSIKELTILINQHYLLLAEVNQQIVGYVIAAGWDFFAGQGIYSALVKRLDRIEHEGPKLTVKNCCQYGPIWISPSYRGKGIFVPLVAELNDAVKHKYPYMLTFIAEDNSRSFAAHTAKAEMQVVDFIGFERRDYYLLLKRT
ncbi:GNAT family N-acetyltransferase [Shewanella sp. SR44-3]|uniref:GNAT family N-acetyltransferase n=1 Tax=unclassified Shewanella TaxID=196818 RepID=UPI0015FD6914|nr:GNAT family N-acetyltransferase [Shewanella sp. SR44-3]MBB1268927.1 GNAT family N-acetyltransferase [Shewanella sp. SR44-3]